MKNLPLIERALGHGPRIAVRSACGASTYQQLVDGSSGVAAALLDDCDDLEEARVAFLVPPGEQYVHAQWGIWRAGGIAVPLSPAAAPQELEYVLVDSQAKQVLVAREFADKLAELRGRMGVAVIEVDDLQPSAGRLPEIATTRPAMILYTSGTTSKPKGVVTTHDCIQAQIESLVGAWRWSQQDRIPLFLPLHHIHGIVNVMLCALWSGAEVEAFARFDLDVILSRIANRAYTLLMAVPTVYAKCTEALEKMPPVEREAVVRGMADMRLMVSGSAALPARLHRRWTELTGHRLLERYGMTEIGMAISNPYDGERRPGFVGLPLPGVNIRLIADSGEVVSQEGVVGEIQVQGPTVFQQYWNKPEATRESFRDGWFRTGDLAVIENGYYRIIGRSSIDIIKSGGHKLSALEIEAILLDHPEVAQCAVLGVPDDVWGETVATAVVLKSGAALDLDLLQQWCRERVSTHKIPRRLIIVDSLPRNAMGKVEKRTVKMLFAGCDATSPARIESGGPNG